MPARKANNTASLTDMIDSDGDLDMMPPAGSDQENEHAEVPKRGKRAATTKPRATKPRAKRLSGGKPRPAKAKASSKRAPLMDQQNGQQQTDAEDAGDLDDIETEENAVEQPAPQIEEPEPAPKKQPGRKGRPPGKAKQQAAAKSAAEKVKAVEKDGEFEYTPTKLSGSGADSKNKSIYQKDGVETPEPEPEPEDTEADNDEHTLLSVEEEETRVELPAKQAVSKRNAPRQPMVATVPSRRRAGSASDSERGSDPALRRKLGEMTRKLEYTESRYRDLREIGVVEAEANYNRLKKQSEQRTKAANDLIESLRAELEAQRSMTEDARSQNSDFSEAQKEAAKHKSAMIMLEAAHASLQNENRTLQAKLAASRTASQDNAKSTTTSARGRTMAAKGAGNAGADLQIAQLKEVLYSDLTDLIVRGVDRDQDLDVYDCIQTGRNGTLHFKLSIAADKEGVSYEDTEFSYEPRLDANRDRDLIEILPEYLCEDITFSRNNAAKFYTRIADTLTKKLVD